MNNLTTRNRRKINRFKFLAIINKKKAEVVAKTAEVRKMFDFFFKLRNKVSLYCTPYIFNRKIIYPYTIDVFGR